MTSKEHNLPAGVTEEPISSKPLNIANIHNMRINANVTEVQTLLRYHQSFSYITCFTNINDKTIRKIRTEMINRTIMEDDPNLAKKEKILSSYHLKSNRCLYYINEFLILYARFHPQDPNQAFDLESLLMTWNVIGNHINLKNININDILYACRLMLEEVLLVDDEPIGIWLKYSKDYKAFYTYICNSDKKQNQTGYVELKSIHEIEDKMLQKEPLKKCD